MKAMASYKTQNPLTLSRITRFLSGDHCTIVRPCWFLIQVFLGYKPLTGLSWQFECIHQLHHKCWHVSAEEKKILKCSYRKIICKNSLQFLYFFFFFLFLVFSLMIHVKQLSYVRLFATPWTIQPMEFSRPEYWSEQPFPSPGDLPNPKFKPRTPALQADSLPTEQYRDSI